MAISQSQKIDLLYKGALGVTKTDLETNKSASNEVIPNTPLIRSDSIWRQSGSIPSTASAVSGIVSSLVVTPVECSPDLTTVPVGGIYPTWLTGLTDWIPPQFGSGYLVKVYIDSAAAANPAQTGTQIFETGVGGTGEYYFNYSSGVLNFIGGTIPAALTSGKKIYIAGYRYVGLKGLPEPLCRGYEHAQTSASKTWTISHGTGSRRVQTSVYDAGGELIIPESVRIINTNEVQVTFAAAITGNAVLVSF